MDIGGESTRPGSEGVTAEEELARVEPVISRLADVPLSVDTSKAEVARRALELGACMVNDVTALRGEPELAGVVADGDAYLCLMHMLGEPRTMQERPRTSTSSAGEHRRGTPRAATGSRTLSRLGARRHA